eukprot:Polyplicarium_translucidae@DN122_c0_g1_i1.p3
MKFAAIQAVLAGIALGAKVGCVDMSEADPGSVCKLEVTEESCGASAEDPCGVRKKVGLGEAEAEMCGKCLTLEKDGATVHAKVVGLEESDTGGDADFLLSAEGLQALGQSNPSCGTDELTGVNDEDEECHEEEEEEDGTTTEPSSAVRSCAVLALSAAAVGALV